MTKNTETPGVGHNGDPSLELDKAVKTLSERILNLEEEKRGISEDIKELYVEAKSSGVNVKALRAAIRAKKIPKSEYEEMMNDLDRYLGIIS